MPKGVRLKPGINDLSTLYPDLAEQIAGVDPTQLYATSKSYVDWECDQGHQFTAIGDTGKTCNTYTLSLAKAS